MFNTHKVEIDWGGRKLTLETGRMARQADAAVYAQYGETSVLATVVAAKSVKPGIDFFPLTVNYQEKFYAAGKIPGGFFKREGRPTEKETLTSRLIDRPIRPLFVEGFKNETQVVVTVLSHDLENDPDILGMVAASGCAGGASGTHADAPHHEGPPHRASHPHHGGHGGHHATHGAARDTLDARLAEVARAHGGAGPWAVAGYRMGEHALAAWQRRQPIGDCPLPELWRGARATSPGLTIGQFHDALRQLSDERVLSLHPWTGPLYEMPEPETALLAGHEIAYYASGRTIRPSTSQHRTALAGSP